MKTKEELCRELYEKVDLPRIAEPGERREIMMRMRDGVRLRTQFAYPQGKGPFPTIVVRCCYPDQEEQLKIKAEYSNRFGFAFVVQWCRGVFGSEGIWEPNVNERNDGLDLMKALQKEKQIGGIGYWGDSYLALTGWAMADAVPDKVKTMYLGVYGCDRHTSAYKDGLFRQDILTGWAMNNAGRKVQADYLTSALYRPQVEVDMALWGGRLDWYRDWITHTDRSDPYWQRGFWGMLREIPGKVKIPVYIREGWYDHHLGSALVTWDLLNDEAKQHSVLEIGPWRHNYNVALTHQDTSNLEDNRISSPMEWFYRILVKKEMPEGEVREYMIGQDKWIVSPVTEKKTMQEKCLFLAADGKMCGEKEEEPVSYDYIYDPNDPVMTHGAESLFQSRNEIGSLEQEAPGKRLDVVTFLSEPLEEDLEISGDITVRLFVSTNCEDTAFTAKLMEEFEDGTTVNIRSTITTLGYRNGADARMTYTPGTTEAIDLVMWRICWTLKKGSRLRLDVSSSDFPQYAVHSNYPGVWALQRSIRFAHQKIRCGAETPSCVILPVPAEEEEKQEENSEKTE